MNNLFWYTRKEPIKPTEGETELKFNYFNDSFNLNKVVRTISLEDGRMLVLMDDIHERSIEVPDIDPKTNKMRGKKRERNTYQSEIYLEKEDAERLLSISKL